MIFRVGLTGGIGSGKSTAAHYFEECGIPIIDADVIARDVVSPGQPALSRIIDHFGKSVLLPSGELHRKTLRNIIFSDKKQQIWLENLLHPLIYDEIVNQIQSIQTPYCVIVIPLLTECFDRYRSILDHIIVIDAPEKNQIDWAISRDKSIAGNIQAIMDSQATREERRHIANTVILNQGSLNELKEKIFSLHKSFIDALS